jgi:cell filamentation protein
VRFSWSSWVDAPGLATELSDFVDPYLDPATGILRNRLNLRDQVALDRAEADLTMHRRLEMISKPVRVTPDLQGLQAIHRQLFADVYDWAGEVRTVDIRKGAHGGGGFFMPMSRLESGAGFAFQELADEKQLRGLPRDRFVLRLAHHYDQVNYLHPFREGNGRTQRIFWSQVAAGAGYDLDWRVATAEQNNDASRSAMEDRDFTGLRKMFDDVVRPASGAPLTPELVGQMRELGTSDRGPTQSARVTRADTTISRGTTASRQARGRQEGIER